MWWDIIKSSRIEAYAKFLEEFGPGVELDSLKLDEPEPDLIQLLGDEWHINLEAGEISFHSMTLGHEAFVQGIFENEYPDRYEELIDKILEHKKENPVPQGLSDDASIEWLQHHEFYFTNSVFDASRRGSRRGLLKAVLEYYDNLSYEEASQKLMGVTLSQISVSPNLYETLLSWLFILSGKSDVENTYNKLKHHSTMMEVLKDIDSGKLDDTQFIRSQSGPVRIREI